MITKINTLNLETINKVSLNSESQINRTTPICFFKFINFIVKYV